MLVSCLVFGCSASSFVYRRQAHDHLQVVVLLVTVAAVIGLGKATGASDNLIVLGYMPGALCAAMLASYCGHSLLRRLGTRSQDVRELGRGHRVAGKRQENEKLGIPG